MMKPTDPKLVQLARLVSQTQDHEIDCTVFLQSVAAFIEAGGDTAAEAGSLGEQLDLVRQHMEVCPPCKEEFEALVRACEQG
jgi:hypothetical protein